ncbi:MAG: hypothetical protein M9908_07880 [Phyllobacteriaceae bacterium]|nr:hypothetical protein [Phyllobacteriaceae bacterium]
MPCAFATCRDSYSFLISSIFDGRDRRHCRALYYPCVGIINPAEIAPIASIYLAVWVAIGGRGRLYGAVIGATLVSLLSTAFTGGQVPDVNLGFYTIRWVDWWTVLLGFGFVLVTLFAPQGIGGLFDRLIRREASNELRF